MPIYKLSLPSGVVFQGVGKKGGIERMLVNLTPHPIVLDDGVNSKTYEPSGEVARVTQESKTVGEVDGFTIKTLISVGDNLPDPKEGVQYIVSAMVLAQLPERQDLVAPNTNEAARNDKGHIISVPGFVRA